MLGALSGRIVIAPKSFVMFVPSQPSDEPNAILNQSPDLVDNTMVRGRQSVGGCRDRRMEHWMKAISLAEFGLVRRN